MQAADHRNRQSALSIQNLGDAGARAYNLLQVPSREPLLLHTEFDGLNGIRWVHWVVLRLIGIDEGREHIQSVTVGRSRLGAPKALNPLRAAS